MHVRVHVNSLPNLSAKWDEWDEIPIVCRSIMTIKVGDGIIEALVQVSNQITLIS